MSNAKNFRALEASDDNLQQNGEFNAVPLTNYGPGTHCVYIAFYSDGGWSPCDGLWPTTVGEGALVDNIVLVDGLGHSLRGLEDGDLDIGTFTSMQQTNGFGAWARLYKPITDNDQCTENTTCAWLFSDDTTPSIANDPRMYFGPGNFIRNWLDESITSPRPAAGSPARWRIPARG